MNKPEELSFKPYCLHVFYLKGKEIYVHPDDVSAFFKNPIFIPVTNFGCRKRIKPMQLGCLWGYDVMLQDDIQIMLLPLVGEGKNEESKEKK